jgi:peptidoglycan/xylan/chitin deacetylase (PgdA/CDA1 family)
MPIWKRLLLSLYYHGTLPARSLIGARSRRERRAPWMVLFYHRVADDRLNPWTISHRAFERQMHWLRAHFDMISLAEGQRRLQTGNDRPAVTITFDDGYADNCRRAMPLLIELKIPCTYFVTTQNILAQRPFPHDVKLGHPLSANTPAEIRALADAGIDIGAHTRTHADLGRVHDPRTLREELLVPQQELEHITGRPVRYFAFPYGQHTNLSQAAFDLARTAYDGACSAYGGYNFPGDDPFHIQRIAVDDELVRMKNWLTLDRRKLAANASNHFALAPPQGVTERPADLPAEPLEIGT